MKALLSGRTQRSNSTEPTVRTSHASSATPTQRSKRRERPPRWPEAGGAGLRGTARLLAAAKRGAGYAGARRADTITTSSSGASV